MDDAALDRLFAPLKDASDSAHYFLHESVDHYQDPEVFKYSVDAYIQAARNVTFRVQSQKSAIPEFERWYLPWQAYLRSEPTMKWIHDSRTSITKQRGLEAKSVAHVSIVSSYLEPFAMEFDVEPRTPTSRILRDAVGRIPEKLRRHAMVTIDRWWEADTLSGRELVASLGYSYGVLEALLNSLGRYVVEGTVDLPGIAVAKAGALECVQGLDDARRLSVEADSGDEVQQSFQQTKMGPPDEPARKKIERRFKDMGSLPLRFDDRPLVEIGEELNAFALKTLQMDKYHIPLVWLRKPDGEWTFVLPQYEDKRDKFVFWHRLADEMRAMGADAFAFVSETWMLEAPSSELQEIPDFANHPDRREALGVHLESAEGEFARWITPFRRRRVSGRLVLEDAQFDDDSVIAGFSAPVRRMWEAAVSADEPEE